MSFFPSLPDQSISAQRARRSFGGAARAIATLVVLGAPLLSAESGAQSKSPAGSSKPAASASASATALPQMIDATEEVQRLYVEGDSAFKRGVYTEAEAAFTKAWQLSKSFDVAGALGSTKLEMGKYREAAQYLSYAIRHALPSTKPSARDRIKRDLDAAKEKLATVKLSASPVEAKITIDGAELDPLFVAPEIYVDAGNRSFQATLEGYIPASKNVDAKAGQIYVVELTLERGTVMPGGTAVPLPPDTSTPLPAAILGGLGGAAIVAGAVLIGAAESSKNSMLDLGGMTFTADGRPTCPLEGPGPTDQCDQLRAAAENTDLLFNSSVGVFIGAGALLASATVYMLFIHPLADPKKPAAMRQLLPVVSKDTGGFVLRGSF